MVSRLKLPPSRGHELVKSGKSTICAFSTCAHTHRQHTQQCRQCRCTHTWVQQPGGSAARTSRGRSWAGAGQAVRNRGQAKGAGCAATQQKQQRSEAGTCRTNEVSLNILLIGWPREDRASSRHASSEAGGSDASASRAVTSKSGCSAGIMFRACKLSQQTMVQG